MADDKLEHIAGCLSEVYPLFVQQIIAEQTARAAAIAEAVLDPIEVLLNSNVDALIADAASLKAGDPLANLARAGAGLLWQEVGKKKAKAALNDYLEDNPKLKGAISKSEKFISKTLSLLHLFISLSAEAPFALAQLAYRGVQPLLIQKRNNIDCLKKHIVLLNNGMLTIGLNPAKVNTEISSLVEDLLVELKAAQTDAADVSTNFTRRGGFLASRFTSMRDHLEKADAILSPVDPGGSVYDILVATAKEAAGPEFTTLANRRMALYSIQAFSTLIEGEFQAIKANTRSINLVLASVAAITTDLAKVAQSARVNDLRKRLLKRFDLELNDLIVQVDLSAKAKDGVQSSNVGRLAILWAANVRSLEVQASNIANADLSQPNASGARLEQLKEDFLFAQASINAANFPPDIVAGIEDTKGLETQIETMRKTAATLLDHVESSKDPKRAATAQANIDALLSNFHLIANATNLRLGDSQLALDIIQSAVDEYLAVDINNTDELSAIASVLRALGADRAADHLASGQIKDLMDINKVALASYAGLVLECLIESANNAPDLEMAQNIQSLADKVKLNYFDKLTAASDFLSGSGFDFIDDIKFQIEEVQRTTELVSDIIAKLVKLGVDVGKAAAQVNENVSGIDAAYAKSQQGKGGFLEQAKRNITTAGFGPPPCD